MDGLPSAFPALLRAQNAQKKAARVGFDWDDASQVLDKVEEEIEELREAISCGMRNNIEEELGDLFFSVVNLARKLGVDAETSLAGATRKFVGRFRAVEAEIAAGGGKIEQTSPGGDERSLGQAQGRRRGLTADIGAGLRSSQSRAGATRQGSFAQGAGLPSDSGHPPVNYHAYAACCQGGFYRKSEEVPDAVRCVLVLLRKDGLRPRAHMPCANCASAANVS